MQTNMDKQKIISIGGLVAGIVALSVLGYFVAKKPTLGGDDEAAKLEQQIKDQEDAYFKDKGEYLQIDEIKTDTGIIYRVDKVTQWNGEGKEPAQGYQIIIERPDGKEKVSGEGVMSVQAKDWTEKVSVSVTST